MIECFSALKIECLIVYLKIILILDGFHKKSYTFDVLFNNKDEMLDLKQLTVEVCRIATEAGHFLKEERKNFRRERVMENMRMIMCRMWIKSLKYGW